MKLRGTCERFPVERGALPAGQSRAVKSIIVLNLGWVLLSAAVLAIGLAPLTTLGTVYVIAQAAAVGLLAELQFIGVRRARR